MASTRATTGSRSSSWSCEHEDHQRVEGAARQRALELVATLELGRRPPIDVLDTEAVRAEPLTVLHADIALREALLVLEDRQRELYAIAAEHRSVEA